jgi:hypothetical protein
MYINIKNILNALILLFKIKLTYDCVVLLNENRVKYIFKEKYCNKKEINRKNKILK